MIADRIVIVFLQASCFILYLLQTINATQDIFFLDPKKEMYQINDVVTLSCKTENTKVPNLVLKRKGKFMAFKCQSYVEYPLNLSCGNKGSWYFMNATIPKVTWDYRGKYECVVNNIPRQIYINVTVPSKVELKVSSIAHKIESEKKTVDNSRVKLRGTGIETNPFDLRNLMIKSIEVTCSSMCSYPPPSYLWELTSQKKLSMPLRSLNADNIDCKGNDTIGMATSSSRVQVDCFEQKLVGLQAVECKAVHQHSDEYITRRTFLQCPDAEHIAESSNRSRLISRKTQMRVTTGEMINIVVGCSVGVVLLISGIIMICRHSNKEDDRRPVDQYTMRQNSSDHHSSAYRV